MQYDLHSHSTASDGTLSPRELVARAIDNGVDVLALTDHDTTAGLAEAHDTAAGSRLRLINGVEVSVTWGKQTVHILGLDIDPANPVLQDGLASLREFREWRAEEIGRRLEKAGVPDALAGARRYATGELVSRTHFARYLVECGRAGSIREVFKKFLVNNRPGHVPGQWAALEDVVGWIRGAGGQAAIAHPARYRMSATKMRRLIDEFIVAGGQGIEVVSGSHTPDDCRTVARYAERYDLYATCGSDFHGPENPWIELGKLPALPRGCKPLWSLWAA